MNEIVRVVATVGVLGAQLMLPLAIGGYEAFKSTPAAGVTRRVRRKRAVRDAEAPALVPLRCLKCSAPVPLLARSFACPHCSAGVEPPMDYVRALELRSARDLLLARAERVWRRSRFTSARPVTALMRVGVVGWTAAVLAACASAVSFEWPGAGWIVFLAILLMGVQLFVLLALVGVFVDGRTQLPAIPPAKELRCDAAAGVCAGCGGAFMFARDRFSATCAYCGAENFRAALARASKVAVEEDAGKARGALMAQIRAWQERRTETLGSFAFLAIAEVFYAAVVVFMFVAISVSEAIGL